MKLRKRDLIASVAAIILSHLIYTYDHGSETLTVTIDLGFYTEYTSSSHILFAPDALVENDGIKKKLSTAREKNDVIQIAKPVPFDLDGDGIVEAIVVPSLTNDDKNDGENEWILRVLDLKPLHPSHRSRTSIINGDKMPLYPDEIFHTPRQQRGIDEKLKSKMKNVPIKMTTGHIILHRRNNDDYKHHPTAAFVNNVNNEEEIKVGDNGEDKNENTELIRHYFCGKDWHDTTKCTTPCPSGSHDECPDNEQCFANTPCDYVLGGRTDSSNTNNSDQDDHHDEIEKLVKTPNRGLPSIVTIWSNGDVSLHSLTADKYDPKSNDKKLKKPELELREMWRINPFIISENDENGNTKTKTNTFDLVDFEELDLVLDSHLMIGKYGAAIILAAKYYLSSHDEIEEGRTLITSYHAIGAFKGNVIWAHSSDDNKNHLQQNKTHEPELTNQDDKIQHPKKISSISRRRSRTDMSHRGINDMTNSDNCLHRYYQWVLNPLSNALPHSFNDVKQDAKLVLTHFDRKHKYNKQRKNVSITKGKVNIKNLPLPKLFSSTAKTSHPLQYKEPNVVLFHNRDGINVISLRNGNPVCHIPLLPGGIYADVNQDGIIDHLQVNTDNMNTEISNPWPTGNSTSFSRIMREEDIISKENSSQPEHICHATLLSGMPAHEQLFRTYLCSGLTNSHKRKRGGTSLAQLKELGTSSAMPLLIEGYDNNRRKIVKDIVFALNHGSLQRYDANGMLQWSRNQPYVDIPTWNIDSKENVGFLGRIDFIASLQTSANRPILLLGDDKMSIVSSGNGKVLDSRTLPQLALGKPILADIDGDGTTDVVVMTKDAVWGYCVKVSGRSSLIRAIILILLLGLGIAFIIHEFGQDIGRSDRATDAN